MDFSWLFSIFFGVTLGLLWYFTNQKKKHRYLPCAAPVGAGQMSSRSGSVAFWVAWKDPRCRGNCETFGDMMIMDI
jgi:hypothetical protein